MSKTGSYRYIEGRWVKVSDKPPRLVDAYVPEGGYIDETLGQPIGDTGGWQPARIETKEQKAALMREKGIVEDGGFKKIKRVQYFDQGR